MHVKTSAWRAVSTVTAQSFLTARVPVCRARTPQRTQRTMATSMDADRLVRLINMLHAGELHWGTRTPIKDVPAWVTPMVSEGGFVTGELLAGGHLTPCDLEAYRRAGLQPTYHEQRDHPHYGMPDRTRLNCHYTSGQGLEELQQRLRTGCYRIDLPEEGALMVVAWLLGRGMQSEACDLLETIIPFFDRLRFYPRPTDDPVRVAEDRVHVTTVHAAREALESLTVPRSLIKHELACGTWRPLTDQVLDLFLETVDGVPPQLVLGPEGQPVRTQQGAWQVQGGWPCQVYPLGWQARAQQVWQGLQGEDLPSGRKHHLGRTVKVLQTCISGPEGLTGRQVAALRETMALWLHRRGHAQSELRAAATAADVHQVAACQRSREAAEEMLGRLAAYPGDAGCPALASEILTPAPGLPKFPPSVSRKVVRCLDMPLEEHLRARTVPSAEVLATILPQLSSQVVAAALVGQQGHATGAGVASGAEETGAASDLTSAALLVASLYSAFRRRRSLLLLNLQSQVRLDELPWFSALAKVLRPGDSDANQVQSAALQASLQFLRRVAVLYMQHFSGVLLPNKLLQELQAMAATAGLSRQQLPLVDELAADIFMNQFSVKFVRAAQVAAQMMRGGSLYAAYYHIDCEEVLKLDASAGRVGTDALVALCKRRAQQQAGNQAGGRASSVAVNGTVIEQELVLTTHNLAALVSFLSLQGEELKPRQLAERAWGTFVRLVRVGRSLEGNWHLQLCYAKDAAYAWRNMVFFLSLLPSGAQSEFLQWAEQRLDKWENARVAPKPGLLRVLRQALQGLEQAHARMSAQGGGAMRQVSTEEPERVLGWVVGKKPWLMA